ncbi:MAG TPA: hemerythrin domain-containing protein [Acidimicrobiales bacterium]|nr:hemerythrin domain-containing protein [Acidimicrobiales bacterium]
MDAITLLKNDHKTVERLFKQFEKADKAGDDETKSSVVDAIIEELSVHAAIEEQEFYPAVREALPTVEDEVLEGLEEHHIVKWTLSELDGMDPSHERFDAKVTVLIESVRHHVEEEEGDLFPQIRQALGRKRLGEIGDAMEEAKKTAPTRPHPKAPDTPPGNIAANKAAGVLDRARTGAKRGAAKAKDKAKTKTETAQEKTETAKVKAAVGKAKGKAKVKAKA